MVALTLSLVSEDALVAKLSRFLLLCVTSVSHSMLHVRLLGGAQYRRSQAYTILALSQLSVDYAL